MNTFDRFYHEPSIDRPPTPLSKKLPKNNNTSRTTPKKSNTGGGSRRKQVVVDEETTPSSTLTNEDDNEDTYTPTRSTIVSSSSSTAYRDDEQMASSYNNSVDEDDIDTQSYSSSSSHRGKRHKQAADKLLQTRKPPSLSSHNKPTQMLPSPSANKKGGPSDVSLSRSRILADMLGSGSKPKHHPRSSPQPTTPRRRAQFGQQLVLSVTPPRSPDGSSSDFDEYDRSRPVRDIAKSPSLMKTTLKVLSLEKELFLRQQRRQEEDEANRKALEDRDSVARQRVKSNLAKKKHHLEEEKKRLADKKRRAAEKQRIEQERSREKSEKADKRRKEEGEVSTLQRQLSQVQQDNSRLIDDLQDAHALVESLRRELQLNFDEGSILDKEVKQLRSALAGRTAERDTLEGELAEMVQHNKELLDTIGQRERAEGDLSSCMRKCKDLERKCARLQVEVTDHTEAAAKAKEDNQAKLDKAYRDAAKQIKEANKAVATITAETPTKDEIAILRNALSSAEEARSALEGELTALKSSAFHSRTMKMHLAEEGDTRTFIMETENTRRWVIIKEHMQAVQSTTQSTAARTEAGLSQLAASLKMAASSSEEKVSQLRSKLEANAESTDQEISALRARIASAENELDHTRREKERSMAEAEGRFSVELDALNATVTQLHSQLSEVPKSVSGTLAQFDAMWIGLISTRSNVYSEEAQVRAFYLSNHIRSILTISERDTQYERARVSLATRSLVFGSDNKKQEDVSLESLDRAMIEQEEVSQREWIFDTILKTTIMPMCEVLSTERAAREVEVGRMEKTIKAERDGWVVRERAFEDRETQSHSRHTRLVNTLGQGRNKAERNAHEATERADRFQIALAFSTDLNDLHANFTKFIQVSNSSLLEELALRDEEHDEAISELTNRLTVAFERQLASAELDAAAERDGLIDMVADLEEKLVAVELECTTQADKAINSSMLEKDRAHAAEIDVLKDAHDLKFAALEAATGSKIASLEVLTASHHAQMEALRSAHGVELREQLDLHRKGMYELEDAHRVTTRQLEEALHAESLKLKSAQHSTSESHSHQLALHELEALQFRRELSGLEMELRGMLARGLEEGANRIDQITVLHQEQLNAAINELKVVEARLAEAHQEKASLSASLLDAHHDAEKAYLARDQHELELGRVRQHVEALLSQLEVSNVSLQTEHPHHPLNSHTRDLDVSRSPQGMMNIGGGGGVGGNPHSSSLLAGALFPPQHATATPQIVTVAGGVMRIDPSADMDDMDTLRATNRQLRKQLGFCVDRLHELEGSVGVLQGRRKERLELLYGLPFYDQIQQQQQSITFTPQQNASSISSIQRHHNTVHDVTSEIRRALAGDYRLPTVNTSSPSRLGHASLSLTPPHRGGAGAAKNNDRSHTTSPTKALRYHTSPSRNRAVSDSASNVLLQASQMASETYRATLSDERDLRRRVEEDNSTLLKKLAAAENNIAKLEESGRSSQMSITNVKKELLMWKEKHTDALHEVASKDASLTEAMSTANSLKSQICKSDDTMDKLVGEMSSLRGNYEKAVSEVKRLRSEIMAIKEASSSEKGGTQPCVGCEQLKAALAVADLHHQSKLKESRNRTDTSRTTTPQKANKTQNGRPSQMRPVETQTTPTRASQISFTTPSSPQHDHNTKSKPQMKNKKVQVATLTDAVRTLPCVECDKRRQQFSSTSPARRSVLTDDSVSRVRSPPRGKAEERRNGKVMSATASPPRHAPPVSLINLRDHSKSRGASNGHHHRAPPSEEDASKSRNSSTQRISGSSPRKTPTSATLKPTVVKSPSTEGVPGVLRTPTVSTSPPRAVVALSRKPSTASTSAPGDSGIVSPIQAPDAWGDLLGDGWKQVDERLSLPHRRSEDSYNARSTPSPIRSPPTSTVNDGVIGSYPNPLTSTVDPLIDVSARVLHAVRERMSSPVASTFSDRADGISDDRTSPHHVNLVDTTGGVTSGLDSRRPHGGLPSLSRSPSPTAATFERRNLPSDVESMLAVSVDLSRSATPRSLVPKPVRAFVPPPPRRATLHSPPRSKPSSRRSSVLSDTLPLGSQRATTAPVRPPYTTTTNTNNYSTSPARGASGEIRLTSDVVALAGRLFNPRPFASTPPPGKGPYSSALLAPSSPLSSLLYDSNNMGTTSRSGSRGRSPSSPLLVSTSRMVVPNVLHRYPISDHRQYPSEFLKSVQHQRDHF